jgi:hypothetical protein
MIINYYLYFQSHSWSNDYHVITLFSVFRYIFFNASIYFTVVICGYNIIE